MRPIYYWKPKRIKAHIGICFLAYSIICYAGKIIKNNKFNFSINDLKKDILNDQYSLIKSESTKKIFKLPSKTTHIQSSIYKHLRIVRSEKLSYNKSRFVASLNGQYALPERQVMKIFKIVHRT